MTNLDHADKIMAAKPRSMLIVAEPVKVTNIKEGGTLHLPQGRKVRVTSATGSTVFATDAETLDCVAFGHKEALAFDVAP